MNDPVILMLALMFALAMAVVSTVFGGEEEE